MRMESMSKLLALSVVFSLVACATDAEIQARRDALPDYARPLGMGWVVSCTNGTVSSEFFNGLDAFQDESGAPLSYERFCEINFRNTRINRE